MNICVFIDSSHGTGDIYLRFSAHTLTWRHRIGILEIARVKCRRASLVTVVLSFSASARSMRQELLPAEFMMIC
jgi:hypothetical protein